MNIKSVPIFLVHGLTGTNGSVAPLDRHLREYGFKTVHRINYPSTELSFDRACRLIGKKIKKKLKRPDKEIILIGHSYAGLICKQMHNYDLNVRLCFMITTPQNGLTLFSQGPFKDIAKWWCGEPYEYLKDNIPVEEPPFDYYTIGTNLWANGFDGVIFEDGTKIRPDKHIHISSSTHGLIKFDKRLFAAIVDKIITQKNDKIIS